jgi:hypothetical protein
MVEDNSQQPPKTTIRQMLDIMADLIARQRDLGSICRQLDWDNRELRLRVDALERQAEAYRRKYPIE